MIRWLRDIFLVLIGRGVVVSSDTVRLTAQIEVLASVLSRMEPFRTEPKTQNETMKSTSLARLQFAVAYLATLPALFAKTKQALAEAQGHQMPQDTKRRLEELEAEVAAKTAELAQFDALADEAAAAVEAADNADDALPGADPELTGDGTGDALPPVVPDPPVPDPVPDLEPPAPPIVDGTENPPGGDPLAPEDNQPPAPPTPSE